jgi:hypothetical protein
MKSAFFLSTAIFSVVSGQGLRSSIQRRLSVNSTSNDGFFPVDFGEELGDVVTTDDSSNATDVLSMDLGDELLDDSDVATDDSSSNATKTTRSTQCGSSQREVGITVNTDKYGWETSWLLRMKGRSGVIKRSQSYESNQTYNHKLCLNIGMYEFIIKDTFSDFEGQYKITVGDRVAVTGSSFSGKKIHLIDVGQTESTMTERDALYLEAHNVRRKEWHARYNKAYVPLKW